MSGGLNEKVKTYSPFTLALAAAALSVFITLALLETALQVLPVRSYIPFSPVTAENPALRYKADIPYRYAAGWDFDAYNRGQTNVQGYVSDFDYVEDDPSPLIAVIGDSYVEARMIPFQKTMQEQLRKKLGSGVRVYNFAIGGAPLSQYLIFARHAKEKYHPDFLIVNIVSNDFDESLLRYKNLPRFHYFVFDTQDDIHPKLVPYNPSWVKEIVSRSALVRYLYFHLNFERTVNRILFSLRKKERTAEPADAKNEKDVLSKRAIDVFLKLLPEYSGLPKSRILLVVDGQRQSIYTGEAEDIRQESYFGRMRTHLIRQAGHSGYEIIDMHPVFERHYAAHGQKFQFEKDGHWNTLAHRLAAQEILENPALAPFKNKER